MSKLREVAKPAARRRFKLAGCLRCGGDAFLDLSDGAEWRCLQCGRTVADQPGVKASALTPTEIYYKKAVRRAA